jgi:putative FmdB family regulatory protein
MPSYDYECARCGVFSASRPVAEYDQPALCPGCTQPAPRTLTLPAFGMSDRSRFSAQSVNERSANAPRSSHGGGCACCRPRTTTPGEAKSAPGGRPWMIGH